MYQPAQLGANIRRFRKMRGLSQAALAQKLFVTPQNISKWENGLSVPDVKNLCLVAEALGVGVERLLGSEPAAHGRIMIGIDGGGTKTEFCLFSENGHVLARERLSGTNPNIYGIEGTISTLKKGIDALTVRENGVCAIFAGIAGCGVESNRRAVLSALKKEYPGVRIELKSDAYNVIYSTEHFERCFMAIMGTGSVVFVKTPDAFHRLGGWGYLFDNGFSGYAIARDGVMAALAAEDGSGEPTVLLDMLKKALNGGVFDNIPKLYAASKDTLADYAKLVFDAYRSGDAVAAQILRERAEQLRHQLARGAALYDAGNRVILAGGLLRDREIVLSLLNSEKFTYEIPALPPIFGACHYCTRMLGEPHTDFAENFEKTYAELIKE